MKVLITNDDGIDSLGLRTLAKAFSKIAEVYVIAPASERSTFSHHLTIRGTMEYEEREVPGTVKAYALQGTPADCAHVGITHFFKDELDLVVSGINRGKNLSTDIVYSGTIAAAREAFIYHVPSLAVSLCSFTSDEYDVAAEYAVDIALKYLSSPDKNAYFLNVNVPAISKDEIKGIRVCDLVTEVTYTDTLKERHEDGRHYLDIVPGVMYMKDECDDLRVDFAATENGYVSVSPLYNSHISLDYLHSVEELLKD